MIYRTLEEKFYSEGKFFYTFKKTLAQAGVVHSPIENSDIYRKLFVENEDLHFYELKKSTQTFIGLFKSRGFGAIHLRCSFEKGLSSAKQRARRAVG